MPVRRKRNAGYFLALALAALFALPVSWTPLATQIDNYACDWMFRLHAPQPWQPESAILAIDDASFAYIDGVSHLRGALAKALQSVASAKPKVVVVDVILADKGDPAENGPLEASLRALPNVILSAQMVSGKWEDPLPAFRAAAVAIGHVHADPDLQDGMSRRMPLEKAAGADRRWSLSFEAYRLSRRLNQLTESPDDIQAGGVVIPVPRRGGRSMRIRFLPPQDDESSRIPHTTLKELLQDPRLAARFTEKVVFVGATAQTALHDRLMTPYTLRIPMPGVEIHAQAFETLAQGRFLTDVPASTVVLACLAIAAAAGLVFLFLSGWPAYSLGALIVICAHVIPHLLFLNGIIFPYFAPVIVAWLTVSATATYQHFAVRRDLRRAESEKSRYQQAIHFVTHEMKTPLTAIQGSSELMGRYNLPEDKRKQIAEMINTESKRLAGMIQTFLNVERLSDGEMSLKKEPVSARQLLDACLVRIRPIAEKKSIRVTLAPSPDCTIIGDRELMEYAVYNLLTNAVKYSPAETHVQVITTREDGLLRLAVKDEGIGMDEKELRNVFRKFYRTKKAEASGESGTGIGLSIVEQIVVHHGGRMEVSSSPGQGSCFTMILPATE